VEIGYKVDGTVTDVDLLIKNSDGKTVATLSASDLSEGNHFLTWDGKNSSGTALDPGTYSIQISAKNGTTASASVSPLVRSEVTGIDLSGSEAKIVTALGEYAISAIHGAYDSTQSALADSDG
jgi:flagellar basal-body rod modification protein FlgD